MKRKVCFFLGAAGILAGGCVHDKKEEPVVAERYVHKYGYALSKEDWNTNTYPGQVITSLRNGVTITTTYEGGLLHGACTHTFPNSQTVQSYFLYNQGEKVKEIEYDIQGMPINETVQISPTRITKTVWYTNGTPLCIEDYCNDELLEGQYFTQNNEIEARVEKGTGQRICRDREGILLTKDNFEKGYMVRREAYYSNNTPESISQFKEGKLHGEKRTFTATGEPRSIEEWIEGAQHGKCTYFKNGTKDYEVSYLFGNKHGSEIHYIDGESVLKEIVWNHGKKHGPATYFIDGIAQTEWYYDGNKVSYEDYSKELKLDEKIAQAAHQNEGNNKR